jgi:hypothetical protein
LIDLAVERTLDVSNLLEVGNRKIFVASERLSLAAQNSNNLFAALATPKYVVIVEAGELFGYSVPSGRRVDFNKVFDKNPGFKEKFLNTSSLPNNLNILRWEGSLSGESGTDHPVTIDDVRRYMSTFGTQVREYFDQIHAEVENYKFSVEKHGEGMRIELQFRATLQPRPGEPAKAIQQ